MALLAVDVALVACKKPARCAAHPHASPGSQVRATAPRPSALLCAPLQRLDALLASAVVVVSACGDPAAAPAGGADAARGFTFSEMDSSVGGNAVDTGSGGKADSAAKDASAEANSTPDAAVGTDSAVADVDAAKPVDAKADTTPTPDVGADPAICGNAVCEAGETWATCSQDCEAPADVCGDGLCTPGENQVACPVDCDADFAGVVACLGNKCKALLQACLAETGCVTTLGNGIPCLANCMDDQCLQTCIDSQSFNSNAKALAACGFKACAKAAPGAICGDGKCDATESAQTCAVDCGAAPVGPMCADGTCDANESAKTCPMDCDAKGKAAWQCSQQKCPKETEDCKNDPGCIPALLAAGECIEKCGGGDKCAQQCAGPVLGNPAALAIASCGLSNCQ